MRMNRSICTSALHRFVRESGDLAKPLTSHPIFASNHFFHDARTVAHPLLEWVIQWINLNLWPLRWTNAEMADWWKLTMLYSSWRGRFEWTLLTLPPCFVQLLGVGAKMKHYPVTIDMIERMGSKGTTPNSSTRNIMMIYLCQLKRSHLGSSVLWKMVKLGLEPTTASF